MEGDSECPSNSSKSEKDASEQPPPMPSGPKTRYDWYQTQTHVIVTIMLKNVKKEDVNADIQEKTLSATVKLPSGSDYCLELDLSHPIIPDESQTKVLSTKIEIKLKKADGIQWRKLEGEDELPGIKSTSDVSGDSAKYPTSSRQTTDWNKLAHEVEDEEKNEKKEGDASLNDLFQKIYKDGTDETKKAMMKSFYESGGTVLSTNWKEVGDKKVDVKPPDGMEYKNWEK